MNASTVSQVVVPPDTISVRFVLFYDPVLDDAADVAAWDDATDECGAGAVNPFGTPGFSPWSECVGRHIVEKTNAAYAALLGSPAPLLKFDSFTTRPNAAVTRGQRKNDLPDMLEGEALPGVLNVFLVLAIADGAGVADPQQPYPSADSGLVVVLRAENGWKALSHELGHAMGFPHVAGDTVPASISYPCCGGMQIATIQGGCDRAASSLMCESGGISFDTCQHGAFLKNIAGCWLSGRGNRGCEQ